MTLASNRTRRATGKEPVGHFSHSDGPVRPSPYFRRKQWLDLSLAYLVCLPAFLVVGCLMLLVKLTSRGPAIYRQQRLGKHRRPYVMYKLRTMRADAEAGTGPVWTQANDTRVTFVGRILRKLHLDELPQIVNVLRGEMSFVGPRPERPEFVRVLNDALPHYPDRLEIPPGITGLAQINLPPDSDLASVQRKLMLDLEYARTATLWLDLRLIGCTALRIFKFPESWLTRLLSLRRTAHLPAALAEALKQTGVEKEATPASILVEAAALAEMQRKPR